jgi:hypothetical protein
MPPVLGVMLLLCISAESSGKVAIYWGQDDGVTAEDNLLSVAADPSIGRIYMSFALPCPGSKIFTAGGASYIDLSLSGHAHGRDCTVLTDYPGITSRDCNSYVPDCTRCENCSLPLAAQIKEAQARGVEVLLSVGGGAESSGSPPDPAQFVEVLSNMYLTPQSDYTGPRPFGDVVLDGIDLDMEQEWGQMPSTWMPSFVDRFPSAPLLTIAPQCFDFNTQYRGSITGVVAADKSTNALLSPEHICRFDSLNVQFYNNEGDLSDGSDFPTSGTDEALAKVLNDTAVDCWDDYTYGWYQKGKHHCFASKFLTTAAIWANVAQQCTAWRASREDMYHGATQFFFGTPVDQLAPDGSAGGLPWPVYAQETTLTVPRRQLATLVQALSKLAGDSFGGVMLWDRGNDLTVGAQMPGGANPSALFKGVMGATEFVV